MRVNDYKPHIVIIPEDRANSEIANGFLLGLQEGVNMQVLPKADGWTNVVRQFQQLEVPRLRRYMTRLVVLLIDFDEDDARLDKVKNQIPEDISDRVFVLGSWTNPEKARTAFGKTFEQIGLALEAECRKGTNELWEHALLQHNIPEVTRLRSATHSVLQDF